MKKQLYAVIMSAIVAIGAVAAQAADYTPLSAGQQSITFKNSDKFDNSAAGEFDMSFPIVSTTLGILELVNTSSYTNRADADKFIVRFKAENDSDETITYAQMDFKASDITTNTEDGAIVLNVQVNGTATDIATVNATGLTVVGNVGSTTLQGHTGGSATNDILLSTGTTNTIIFRNGIFISSTPK